MRSRPEIVVSGLDGDLRRGGWIYSASVQGDTDAVQPGEFIQVKGRSLAGWVDAAARLVAEGYALGRPDFSFDRYSSQASFQFGTADNLLRGSVQALSATVVSSPDNSHQYASFRFSSVVAHILKAHTNFVYSSSAGANGSPEGIIYTLDLDGSSVLFDQTGDRFIVNKSENIWSTLQQIGGGEEGGGEFHRPWFDRRGVFHYQPAPPFISPTPTAKGTLTKDHLRGAVQVQYVADQFDQRTGQVTMVSGLRPGTIYNSRYPASPGLGKILQKNSGVWSQSQSAANTHAERLWKWLNRPYTLTVQVDAGLALFGDDGRGLDLADRVLLTYNGPAEDTATGAGVHLNLSSQGFYIYAIRGQLDPARRTGVVSLTLEYDVN